MTTIIILSVDMHRLFIVNKCLGFKLSVEWKCLEKIFSSSLFPLIKHTVGLHKVCRLPILCTILILFVVESVHILILVEAHILVIHSFLAAIKLSEGIYSTVDLPWHHCA